MTILLLGANGQVGHALRAPLASVGDAIAATRSGTLDDGTSCTRVDLADSDALRDALESIKPTIIVNAAAYTAVDRAEDEPDLADRINHRAVAELGAWAARNDTLVVHYSTDYVFDGQSARAYHEDDATAPLGVYGRSKLAGEVALHASGARHLILRTAWVYGARGSNFLLTMLRLARERDELRVVGDQIGTPTPAHWIAGATAQLLTRLARMSAHDRTQALGTWHLTAQSPCSWHTFAIAIMREALAAGLIERAPLVQEIRTAEYPTRAQRPPRSVLDGAKLALVFGLQLPDWGIGLREVIAELAHEHGDLQ